MILRNFRKELTAENQYFVLYFSKQQSFTQSGIELFNNTQNIITSKLSSSAKF